MKQALFSFLLILATVGCQHEPVTPVIINTGGNDGGSGTGGVHNGIPCNADTVYFEQDILPLLVSNCAMPGCHDAGTAQENVILTNYQHIIQTGEIVAGFPDGSELFEKITENDLDDRMPPLPAAGLSTDQIALVRKWIQQGAQNNRCNSNNGPCDTSNISFSGHIKPVLQGNCVGCHHASLSSGGINLSTHAGVVSAATSGRLTGAVRHQTGYVSMPPGGNALDSCNIAKIEYWILKGLPNN